MLLGTFQSSVHIYSQLLIHAVFDDTEYSLVTVCTFKAFHLNFPNVLVAYLTVLQDTAGDTVHGTGISEKAV